MKTELFDLEAILTPISDGSPAGDDLRYEPVYDDLKELRKEDDPSLPQGIWEGELKVADWKGLKRTAIDVLTNQSKDLQVAAWLLEALVNIHGVKGAREGLQLIYSLCETFWDDLYPAIYEDDVELRVSPITWINESVSGKLKLMPLVLGTDETDTYNLLDYKEVARIEMLIQQSPRAKKDVEDKRYLRPAFDASVKRQGAKVAEENVKEMEAALDLVNELDTFLEERCGDETPSLIRFRDGLIEVKPVIEKIVPKESSEESDPDSEVPEEEPAVLDPGSTSRINGRNDAYQRLSDIADYLLEIEPHSPAPYLIKRAVKWGELELSELLMELLKDGQNLQQVYSLLGIKP